MAEDVLEALTEPDQALEASKAREAATLPRQRVNREQVGPEAPTAERPVGGNYFDQFDGDPKDDGVAVAERGRLNRQEAYYRGSLAGAARLETMSHLATTPDPPEMPPERKKVNDDLRKEFVAIKADLAAYDLMKPWETTLEATVSFGNQLLGTMVSPESWLGWGAKGTTALMRTAKAGLQQGAIQAATDPVVQALNLASGVQEEFDWTRMGSAAVLGAVIGGGMHGASEGLARVIGPLMERRQMVDLSRMDPAFESAWMQREAMWRMSPETGAKFIAPEDVPEPVVGENFLQYIARAGLGEDLVKARRGEPTSAAFDEAHDIFMDRQEEKQQAVVSHETAAARDYGPGPEHGFDDTVAKISGQQPLDRKRTKNKDGQVVTTGVTGDVARTDARWAAFTEEVGPDLDAILAKYEQGPDAAIGISEFYKRAPGEHPKAALERAFDEWGASVEAEAIRLSDFDTLDSEIRADWGKAERIQAAYDQAQKASDFHYQSGRLASLGQGTDQTLPGITPSLSIRRGFAHDVPFEPGVREAEGGRVAEGGRSAPGESEGTAGPGQEVRDAGGPGAERPAAAKGVRGERVILKGPERKTLLAERRKLIDEAKVLGAKGDLTREEARLYGDKQKQISEVDYQLASPGDPAKVASPEESKSALAPATVVAAYEDTLRSRPVFMALREAAAGVTFNADTAIDKIMLGQNPEISAQQFYDTFQNTRDALRAQFGDTLTLYRSEGKQKAKATQNWATTREFAEQFGDNIKIAQVPVDDVVGAFVNRNGKYHELIVGAPPGRETAGAADGRGTGTQGIVGETLQDQAQAASGGPAPVAKLPGVGPVADTRGGGVQYHGTGDAELKPDSSHYSSLNYYGQGFYTTDAVDVAGGYARSKRNRKGEPSLYRIEEKRPLNILDGEQPLPADVRKVLTPITDTDGTGMGSLLREAQRDGVDNMRKLYDWLRDDGTAKGYTADDIQGVFDSINYALRELGYNGMSHEGGVLSKKKPHRVVIYFDPEKDIRVVKEGFPGQKAKEVPTPEAPVAETPRAAAPEIEPPNIAAKDLNALKERMPKEDADEFMLLWAMGANDGKSAARDTARFVELAEKYKEGALATERTTQGEQTLVPGVEPITDRQRLEAEGAKPMRGGDAAPGGMFDTDARAQENLFLTGIPDEQELARRRKGGTLNNEQRPAPTMGPPNPKAEIAIRSLQQQVNDLAHALDIPVHEGRVTSKNALGFYKTKYGTVRVKEYPDFEVVVHEAGHAIEGKVGQDLTNLTQLHSFEMMPLDYDQGPKGRRVHEGFAEWVRLYVGNPAFAESVAPNFTQDFRAFMGREFPSVLSELDRAATAYRAYLDADPSAVVGSQRRSHAENKEGMAKLQRDLKKEGFPSVIKSNLQFIYTAILDDKAPVTRVVRELSKAIKEQTGALVDLKAAENPDILWRLAARSQQEAVVDMMHGVVPYHEVNSSGPSLADAIAHATGERSAWGKWDTEKVGKFSDYLIARRAEYLWRKFDAGELPNPPAAFSRQYALATMAEFEAVHPNFKDASDMVHIYANELLRKRYEGNIIDRDLYDKLTKEEFYVPFMRDMSDKPLADGGVGRMGSEGPGNTQTVMRMKGSSRDILDPLESMMLQTLLVNRTLRHNDVILSMVRLAERAGAEGGRFVEPIPAHEAVKYTVDVTPILEQKARDMGMTPNDARDWAQTIGQSLGEDPIVGTYFKMEQAKNKGEPIVFYKEGGELKAARFMSEKDNGGHALYETLMKMPDPITDIWVQMVGASATLLRSAITTNPTFMVSNYIRDQMAAAILRSDYIPFVSGVKGIISEVTQGQSARLYAQAGGVAGGSATGPVDHAVEAELNALAKNGYVVNRFTSLKGLLEVASVTEAGTRNSIFATVYDAKLAQGLSPYEAMVEAAFSAQDMLDFSRHGSHTLVIRNLLPFVNAHMQGLDKAVRTMIDPIVNRIRSGDVFTKDTAEFNNALLSWTKAAGIGGALGAFFAAINWDKESYRDATPYLKGTHFVVPIGGKVLVVPKPFELSTGFTLGEYAFQAMMSDKPQAARQFIEAAWHSMQPPNPLTDIPLISSAMSVYTGKNMMTGNDIVPDTMQRLPPEQQYNDRTSEMAKQIGKMLGMSPMKIDYAIGANFGNWGRDVAALSQGLNEDSPAKGWDDAIFLRRFIKDPTRSNNASTKFWEFMGQTTGKYNQAVAGYDALIKGFKDETGEAQDFVAKLPAGERAFVTLKSAADGNGKAAFTPDERRLHPLQRSYDAVTLLNNMRKELSDNTFKDFQTVQRLKLDPEKRRDLIENLRELSQMEMRNALVILKEPGWEGRPVLDVNDTMDKIKAASPEIAAEVATRYATAKIYTTGAVQAAWPTIQSELVRAGSQADIRGAAYEAQGAGYEFGGIRVKRPAKRRVEMEGAR